ncbi:MAG: HNH endonuclease [Holosporaceae bacterium]|nr:HNH endonuclease [Holosporaceae bacterium]
MRNKIKYKGQTFFRYADGYFRNGRITLHRYKYEKKHGPLLSCFQLHHRDGNKDNNSLNNLQLLTPQEHASLHKALRRAQLFQNQLKFEWE